jgi:sigma-E factor negative regulatory protein RseA
MADKSVEQLSVLVDGECEDWEVEFILRRLARDTVLKERWECYHLISDAMKNNLPALVDTNFSGQIRQIIDAESVLQAPATATSSSSPSSLYKPVVGFSVAASVALIVGLLTLKPFDSPNNLSPDTTLAQTRSPESPTTPSPDTEITLESRLNNYLVNHNEYASMNSVHGVLRYVRLFGYEPKR